VAEAVVGTRPEIAVLAREPRVARTLAVIAVLVVQAPTFTPAQRAVRTHVPAIAHARPVHAFTVP